MTDLRWTSAVELGRLISKKEVSPVEVLEQTFNRIDETEEALNCFVDLKRDEAMQQAKAVETAVVKGENLGPLQGIPLSVKDLIAVKDMRLTFGSRAMKDNVAPIDAPGVERARKAGAVIIGKTTTSEFGCKGVGDSPLTGITRNPWNLSKTPGGSSCGAGASVAAGVTPLAFGTDGGGSIRLPSSMCGLFGIKGHFGRIPVFPVSATPTLAHVGPMTRTVRDAALLLQVAAGFDARDAGAVAQAVPDFLASCERSPKGLRVAWSPTLGYARPDPEVLELVRAAIPVFEEMGCHVEEVDHVIDDPLELFMAEFFAGAGTRLRPVLENNRDLLDPAVADTLDMALGQTMGDYYQSVFRRYDLRTQIAEFFSKYDLLLTPTIPVLPFDAGHNLPPGYEDAPNMFTWIAYTYPFNLTGVPAASIPCGFSKEGLPVGLHIVGQHLGEEKIFAAAAAFEQARPWQDRKPPMK